MKGSICFFNTAIAWGGGEKWHFETCRHLHHQGYKVYAIVHQKSALLKKLEDEHIPVFKIAITNRSFLNPFKRSRIKRLIKENGTETIVMNLSRDVKIAGPAAKKAGVKRIVYRRGSAIPIKNTILNRYVFKNIVNEVLANSEATKMTVLTNNTNLFPKEKIKVIYNGLEIPWNLSSYQNKKNPVFTLASLGRLEAQKNQEFLVKLAANLKSKGLNFRLYIGGEGRLRSKLEEKIAAAGLHELVILTGFIDHPLDFISKCDVFVLPSLWEGFGYVLAEAALCKKPIIAFDVSSNPELVIHNKTGYLTPVNDVEAVADRIMELHGDTNKRNDMGSAGYLHIKKNFDKEIQLQKIEDYLLNG